MPKNWVSNSYDWKQEIILVTGGAGGIGGYIAGLFDMIGARVVVLDIQPGLTFEADSRPLFCLCWLS